MVLYDGCSNAPTLSVSSSFEAPPLPFAIGGSYRPWLCDMLTGVCCVALRSLPLWSGGRFATGVGGREAASSSGAQG